MPRFAIPSEASSRPHEAGLTLPEVIVALVIVALSLSGVFAALSDGLRRTGQAEATAEAVSLAQSLLARIGPEIPIQPGGTAGDLAHGFRWRLLIEPYGDASDQRAWPVTAYIVSAEISWGGGAQEQSTTLSTLRLAAKEALR